MSFGALLTAVVVGKNPRAMRTLIGKIPLEIGYELVSIKIGRFLDIALVVVF